MLGLKLKFMELNSSMLYIFIIFLFLKHLLQSDVCPDRKYLQSLQYYITLYIQAANQAVSCHHLHTLPSPPAPTLLNSHLHIFTG